MQIMFALLSALFAGITSILAKCGIKQTSSNVATAIRTIIVLAFSGLMVTIVGAWQEIAIVDTKSWIFLVLSGVCTGASWLCYFKALQKGDVNKVVPIDKSSTILTFILSFVILQEKITLPKGIGIALSAVGTLLMIQKKAKSDESTAKNDSWIIFAILSAIFAGATSILSKLGVDSGINSNLATAIKTAVVLVMSWLLIVCTNEIGGVCKISKKELLFICLSGVATGISWLCYYKAQQLGANTVIVAIDKLSILVTIPFSMIVFKERLTIKAWIGLTLIVAGTICIVLG